MSRRLQTSRRNDSPPLRSTSPTKVLCIAWLACSWCFYAMGVAQAQPPSDQIEEPSPQAEGDAVTPDSTPPLKIAPDNQIEKPSASGNAWEYDPYHVLVWISYDQSNRLNAIMPELRETIESECRLMDPNGWRVQTQRAPLPWNWKLLLADDLTVYTESLVQLPILEGFDKLICVQLNHRYGGIQVGVRELDIQTRQWGARNVRPVANWMALGREVSQAIKLAFMPLARIDRVVRERAQLRVRAAGLVLHATQHPDGTFTVEPNRQSPLWVSEEDVFRPVVRRLNRDGTLDSVSPIEWTYLTVKKHNRTQLECVSQSAMRAPLTGRVGRRSERFALVIRSPARPTVLKLVSRDPENRRPLPGLEVYSRPTDAKPDDESEFLGTTDWRGKITIPPNENTLRLIYVKSGQRPLARLPIIPGLSDTLTASMPDDQRRLYAEGVVRGLANELLDLVAQRRVTGFMVIDALEDNDLEEAQKQLNELRSLTDANEFNARLANEMKRLQSQDKREAERIKAMFDELMRESSKNLSTDLEAELALKINTARDGGDWRNTSLDRPKGDGTLEGEQGEVSTQATQDAQPAKQPQESTENDEAGTQ